MRYKKAIFFLICFFILILLGLWQVKRLYYKQDLISLYKSNPEITINSKDLERFSEKDWYKKVSLSGEFIKEPIFYYSPHKGKTYYEVYQPFLENSGNIVLVNRGISSKRETPQKQVSKLEGMAVSLKNSKNLTVKNDHKKNIWFYLNYKELSKYYKIDNLLPVIIFTNQEAVLIGKPVNIENKVFVRNDHFQYAVTWFALSVIALIFVALSYKKEKENK